MKTPVVQRWRSHRASYRPAGEVINTTAFDVAEISDDSTAKTFVRGHHYSRSYPAARFRFGLYRGAEFVGVAVFSVPMHTNALRPFTLATAAELGRFVLLDEVPGNGETWFLARCFELLRVEGLAGCVSLSDPAPRTDRAGRVVFPGHVGTIYQAFNGIYTGRSKARTLRLLHDGTVFSERAQSKIRNRERSRSEPIARLEAAGAERYDDRDPAGWLKRALAQVTRPLRHPGNHRYVWAIDRRARRHLPASLPYPKFIPEAA